MHFTEIILLAIGVAMDAFAASICKGIPLKKVAPKHAMLTAFWFGGFQALLPLIGYYLGARFCIKHRSLDCIFIIGNHRRKHAQRIIPKG